MGNGDSYVGISGSQTRVSNQPFPECRCTSRHCGAALRTELRPSQSRHRALPSMPLPPMRGQLAQARGGKKRDQGAASRSGIKKRILQRAASHRRPSAPVRLRPRPRG
ncbi:unnamed protein product [Coccothraustes coccothraustes]